MWLVNLSSEQNCTSLGMENGQSQQILQVRIGIQINTGI